MRQVVVTALVVALASVAAPAGATQQLVFSNFCTVPDFTLNGDAATLTPNPDCTLRLTNDLTQAGSAFVPRPSE